MLRTLYISNYALIDELEIEFGEGLSIITGETGAGKSIILGALSLILGDRADVKSIRNVEKKTVVEATFDITQNELKSFFEQNDIDFDAHCIIRREITPSGRSRAFVNDTPVNVSALKELAMRLVDIHSQHSNMLLADADFQLHVLDEIAQNDSLLLSYRNEYRSYKALQRQLRLLKENFEKSRAEEDYIRFQLSQFDELKLVENEDEELEAEQSKLSHVAELKEVIVNSELQLYSAEGSIVEQLKQVEQRLASCCDKLQQLEWLTERVKNATIELKDVSNSLFALDEDLIDDPKRLEQIEARQNDILALERKHKVNTVNELLALQHRFEEQLQLIDNSDEAMNELEQQLAEQQRHIMRLAQMLSASRKQAAGRFVNQLLPLAHALGMLNLQFDIRFSETEPTLSGSDSVEFCFAFNKNQALMPVKTTASGGEISRLMLCVKSVLARNVQLPTLIFDEVDTGVSGDMASRVGSMMGEMSEHLQVISITHLPQVAAYGRTHFKVYKTDEADSTVTHVDLLDEDAHVQEVARMLSGKDVNRAAIENAKSLINQANVR